MASDLQMEFGKRSGYSSANLWRMRNFYLVYEDDLNLAQLVRDLSWSHNILIFEKCKDEKERKHYLENTIEFGWSRNVLTHHIKTDLYRRDNQTLKQNNFQETLPTTTSDLAEEMMKSEYSLEFLGISKEAKESELEYAISNTNQPLGVATYKIETKLPKDLKDLLPSSEEIREVFDE